MILATLDTGALIAMERNRERGVMLLRAAREQRARLLAITPVVAEWWRGRSDVRDRIKVAVTIVPFPVLAADVAGVALAQVARKKHSPSLTIDMMVMAFAATLGGAVVYTSHVADLSRLGGFFPEVRVLGV